MSKTDIWMPLFIGDYLADTTRLTTEQHGAYFLLIMDYWRNGKPPEDDAVLSNITRMQIKDWKKIKSVVIGFFTLENGFYSHSRIDKELKEASASKEKAEAKAKKAAEKRWAQEAAKHEENESSSNAPSIPSSNAQEVLMQCPSPSPLPITTKTKSKADALATRLPADWSPSDYEIQFCQTERPELNPMAVAAKFKDHWIATPGVKGRKTDWTATWRNWVRSEKAPYKQSTNVQDARLDIANQIWGRGGNGTHNTIIDVESIRSVESDGTVIPKALAGIR